MRPPQNAGEDCIANDPEPQRESGFNEAPAERGGRQVLSREIVLRRTELQ